MRDTVSIRIAQARCLASIFGVGPRHKLDPTDIKGLLGIVRRSNLLLHLFIALGVDTHFTGPVREHATNGEPAGTVGENALVGAQIHPPLIAREHRTDDGLLYRFAFGIDDGPCNGIAFVVHHHANQFLRPIQADITDQIIKQEPSAAIPGQPALLNNDQTKEVACLLRALLFVLAYIAEQNWPEHLVERISLTHKTEIRGMGAIYRCQVITVIPQEPLA